MSESGLGRLAAILALVCGTALAATARPAPGQGRELIEPHDDALSRYGLTGRWQEHPVVVYNYESFTREVLVTNEAVAADGGPVRFTRLIEMPPDTRRCTWVACQIGQLKETGAKIRETPLAEITFSSHDARTGQLLDRRGNNILRLDPMQKLVGFWQVLATDNDTYEYLTRPDTTPISALVPTGGRVRELPDHWYGYDAARIGMVGPLTSAELRPSQLSALLDWVRRGGTLVLVGNPQMPEYLHGELAHAAGATAVGVHNFMELTVTGQGLKAPHQAKLALPLPMVELCPVEAEVLCQANGLPLMLRHRLGDGQVFTLATPLGALADPGLQGLVKLFDQATETRSAVDGDQFPGPARETLAGIAGRRGPRPAVPLTPLAALLAVAVVAGTVLRIWRRGELAWLALAPLAVAIALGFYIGGKLTSDPERLTGIGLVTGLGDGLARVQGSFVYYSGPTGRKLTPTVENGIIQDAGGTAPAVLAPLETRTGRGLSMPDRALRNRDTMGLYVDKVQPMPSPAVKLSFGPAGLTGTIANRLGDDIVNAVVYVNRQTYRMGDLPAGAESPVAVGPGNRLGEGEFTGGLLQDVLANDLINSLSPAPDIFRRVRRSPLLIGQVRGCLADVLPGQTLDRRGWSVVVFPLEFQPPQPGTRVVLPSGFVELEFRRLNMTVWNALTETFVPQSANADVLLAVRPPACVPGLEKASVRIRASLQAANCRLTIAGVPREAAAAGAGAVEIRRFDNPAGPVSAEATDADRFRDASGAYV